MSGFDTVIFDLDGTLLPMDMNVFLKTYLHEISNAFMDIYEPRAFVSHLMNATQHVLSNDGRKKNSELFFEKFELLIDRPLDIFIERFECFYDNEFENLRKVVYPNSYVKESIEILKSKGYRLAIATNPIFPRKAVEKRILWAELDPNDFVYISSFEKNSFCKPHSNFFIEVLDAIGKEAYDCLMVGNDVQEDLAAEKVGIKTYLITDHLINRLEVVAKSAHKGDYKEFFDFAQKLPIVF